MKRVFMFAIGLLLAVGCATSSQRVWYKDNIKATGFVERKGDAVYYAIFAGNDTFPYDGGWQAFAIRLPSGMVLSSDDFSEQTIRPIVLGLLKTGDGVIRHDREYGRRKYFFENVMFEYEGNQLVTMCISWWWGKGKGCVSAIARTTSGTFHLFPVSEKTLNEIFGPPDKTEEFFRW